MKKKKSAELIIFDEYMKYEKDKGTKIIIDAERKAQR